MTLINKLERKLGKFAIRNLMHYIVILYAIGLMIWMISPGIYLQYLCLDAAAIMRGQVWRLFTFLLFPPSLASWQVGGGLMSGMQSMLELLIAIVVLRLYYNLGRTLENIWGTFRFNLFFFIGVIGQIVATLVAYLVFNQWILMTTGYINASLFLAFCLCFPDVEFLLFFALPIKAKWLAAVQTAMYLYDFIKGDTSMRWAIVISLANVIIFFLMTRSYKRYSPKEIKRKSDFRKNVRIRPVGAPRHKCAVCGRTEKDGDDLEFRYCSKCEGDYEYCQDHLYTHQHVTQDQGS
ncbi:MAG: hypothetical protein ACRDBO_02310 [Lachnospiraceae bacterium]